jgi:hypothetical protein
MSLKKYPHFMTFASGSKDYFSIGSKKITIEITRTGRGYWEGE